MIECFYSLTPKRVQYSVAITRPLSQLVQGTAAVHIRGRDGSIPSAATTVGTTSPERRAAA